MDYKHGLLALGVDYFVKLYIISALSNEKPTHLKIAHEVGKIYSMVFIDSKWCTLISDAPFLKMAHSNPKTAQVVVCV